MAGHLMCYTMEICGILGDQITIYVLVKPSDAVLHNIWLPQHLSHYPRGLQQGWFEEIVSKLPPAHARTLTPEHCYSNIKDAFHVIPCPHFGNLGVLRLAYRQ